MMELNFFIVLAVICCAGHFGSLFQKCRENYLSPSLNFTMYYINVSTSMSRNKRMKKKFKDIPWTLKRIEAITPTDLINFPGIEKVCSSSTEYELACTFSHLKAIYTAFIDGNDYALIFEDDVIIKRFPNIEKVIDTAPYDWEILQLFSLDPSVYTGSKGNLWIKHQKDYFTAASYLINRKGMERVLKEYFIGNPPYYQGMPKINTRAFMSMQEFNCAADYVIYMKVNTYVCTDLFFVVETDNSTIHNLHLLQQYYYLNQILNYFMKNGYKYPELGNTFSKV